MFKPFKTSLDKIDCEWLPSQWRVDLHVMIFELGQGIFKEDLGVVDVHQGAILHEHVANHQGWRFAYITCVFLEGKAQNRDFLLGHGVEERLNDFALELQVDTSPKGEG